MSSTSRSNENLYHILRERFPKARDAVWLETTDGAVYTYDELDRATARIANLLARLRLPAGARVAAQVERSPEALILYLATLRAGAAFLPLNTAYRESEIEYFLGNAEPAVVVASESNRPWIEPLAKAAGAVRCFTLNDDRTGTLLDAAAGESDTFETVTRADSDLAAILYTSGTTGRSKGAMLSHGNLSSNARVLHEAWRWRGDDVLLHALPVFHVHGLFVAGNGALFAGAKTLWLPKFDAAEIVRNLPRATVFMGVPTFYTRLLGEPSFSADACRNIRLFVSGSAPLLADTFSEFQARTGKAILERYGMSETLMITSNPYDGERRAGTVGFPLAGISVRIVDNDGKPCAQGEVGVIEVRGPNVFSGYWRMPEKTAEEFSADGWFRTGDLGRLDDDGYVMIVGRSKDLIITGGYNVYPKEIELYIDAIPGVAESAVFGVPHADFGEAVMAAVVARTDASLTESQIIAELKSKIAGFKVPKRVVVVDELPRNAMGKVQKAMLRTTYGQPN
jgi:malonyl-CoA/methylmalonyl-CoA synthetase